MNVNCLWRTNQAVFKQELLKNIVAAQDVKGVFCDTRDNYLKKTFDKKEEQKFGRNAVQPEVEDLRGDQGVEHPPVLGDALQPGGYGAMPGDDDEEEGDDGGVI